MQPQERCPVGWLALLRSISGRCFWLTTETKRILLFCGQSCGSIYGVACSFSSLFFSDAMYASERLLDCRVLYLGHSSEMSASGKNAKRKAKERVDSGTGGRKY